MSLGYMVTVRLLVDANYGVDSREKALAVAKHRLSEESGTLPSELSYAASEGVTLVGYVTEELWGGEKP